MTTLLRIDCRNGTVSKTLPASRKKLSPGRISGGIFVAVAESVEATMNIQYSGNTEPSAATPSSR
jgi:hypothetical protein